jgi:hypothetical protein
MEHQGNIQVRKPEKYTDPKHYYVGGGNNTLNPMAHERIEGYGLFNNITKLDQIGSPNHSILDRFLDPIFGNHNDHLTNESFIDMPNGNGEHAEGSHDKGGH